MTTKYLDSKRISGTTADREGTPAVSGGWKELGRTTLSNTPTGTADYTAGSTSYGTGDSGSAVDLQTQVGSTLGNSWTLRFKLTMTSKANNLIFMVQDINTIDETTTRDGIGLRQTASTSYYDLEGCNGTAPTGGQYDHRFTTTPAIDTKYVQITRVSETSASIQFWNSTYTTVSESSDNIPIADITNLRYFVIYNNGSAFTIDEVSFWNNSASTGASDTIDVSSLADKRYYMVLTNSIASGGSTDVAMRLNTDTGSNYASRRSIDGASDETRTSDTLGIINHFENETCLGVHYLANFSSKEKLGVGHFGLQGSAGAGNAPRRVENVGKWANTSNAINAVNLFQNDSGSFDSGSELVVLGWDPADTHTTNFWEELASVNWSAGGEIDTGTFASKKYLWVQISWQNTTAQWTYMNFNGDNSATKYTSRQSVDGASDGTVVNYPAGEQYYAILGEGSSDVYVNNFANMFIINNPTSEKLGIINSMLVRDGTVGAGYAPRRVEGVFKYTDTSNAITRIQLLKNSGSYSGGTIKVWGSN